MIAVVCSIFLAALGAVFLLLAGVGIIRLPDVYCRASATTKAATLGVGCLLVGTAVHFGDLQITTRVAATVAFLLLTAPVAAHMIARAAYLRGIELWSGTQRDELHDAAEGWKSPHDSNGSN
jgi:multicomponent Na+:H+ antiporter subunit G